MAAVVKAQNCTSFLVIVDDPQAVIANPERGEISPVMHWAALAKFGIWEPMTDPAGAERALNMVRRSGLDRGEPSMHLANVAEGPGPAPLRAVLQEEDAFLVMVDEPRAVIVIPSEGTISDIMHHAALTKFGFGWGPITDEVGAAEAVRLAREAGLEGSCDQSAPHRTP